MNIGFGWPSVNKKTVSISAFEVMCRMTASNAAKVDVDPAGWARSKNLIEESLLALVAGAVHLRTGQRAARWL